MRGHPKDANACARTMPSAMRRVHRVGTRDGRSHPRCLLAGEVAHVDDVDTAWLAAVVALAAAVEPDTPYRRFRASFGFGTETQQLAHDALDRLARDGVEAVARERRLRIRPDPVAILGPYAPTDVAAVVAEIDESPRLHRAVETHERVLVGRVRTVRRAVAQVAGRDAVAVATHGHGAFGTAARSAFAVRVGAARGLTRRERGDRLAAVERVGISGEAGVAQTRTVVAPPVGRARAPGARRAERLVERQIDEAGGQPQRGEPDDATDEHELEHSRSHRAARPGGRRH